ncbi:unnamed protein product [Lactuca saligna]|uniref:F-box associated beta-propeller type 1 domain-containing protein n=1 Tax=Lactuca saligna TaxID=75948 RepID=A0AA35V4U7_LACSI|nr:unnamed protein product [Lactuca saligna]
MNMSSRALISLLRYHVRYGAPKLLSYQLLQLQILPDSKTWNPNAYLFISTSHSLTRRLQKYPSFLSYTTGNGCYGDRFLHSSHHTDLQYLLVKYQDLVDTKEKYVSFIDDETFPKQSFVLTLPSSVQILNLPGLIDCSHGLVFLYDNHPNLRTAMAVLWNPSIRKSIVVDVPNEMYVGHETVVGFGVCPVTIDLMIIKITQFNWWYTEKSEINNPWNVKIYTMSSGNWRILSSNLLSKSFRVTFPQVVIDRFIYWYALHKVPIDGRLRSCNAIVIFDMSNETFGVVDLPDSLAHHPNTELCISKSDNEDDSRKCDQTVFPWLKSEQGICKNGDVAKEKDNKKPLGFPVFGNFCKNDASSVVSTSASIKKEGSTSM